MCFSNTLNLDTIFSCELKSFIYWPTQQEILSYYPDCFKQYDGCVRCIIDCTEIRVQRLSLALTDNAVYSQYKSSPTLKVLIGITPEGTNSFLSKPAGRAASDKEMVKLSGLMEKLEKGNILIADRGFNIQELLLHKEVKLIIPPFKSTTRSTNQFTLSEGKSTKL